MKKQIYNTWKYFFLILFLGYFASTSFFSHAHVVNGVTIIHSHPFKAGKDGKPLHTHNTGAFLLIHILANYVAITIGCLSAALFLVLTREFFRIPPVNMTFQTVIAGCYLRGPPYCLK